MKKMLFIIFFILFSSKAYAEARWSDMGQSVTYLLSVGYEIIKITEVNITNQYTRYHYHLVPINSSEGDPRPVLCNIIFYFENNERDLYNGFTKCYMEIP